MKRLTSIEKAQAVAKAINEFRTVFTGAFTSEQLALQLKSINCPHAKSIFTVLKKSGQIKPIGASQYVFTFPEPTYYKAIQKEVDTIAATHRGYVAKSLSKKPKEKTAPLVVVSNSIEDAIALLKANGYKISKPVITYEEI